MMKMEVSAMSLVVILGIFCSVALAQPPRPSPELQQAMQCMRPAHQECSMPLAQHYQGMNLDQIKNQIRTTDLAQTCGPVLTATECVTNKVSECGLDQVDDPRVADVVQQTRVAAIIVNYVCTTRVEVFNANKECLLEDNGDVQDLARQCPWSSGPTQRFCVPQAFPVCVANLVQQECGEEIANEFRTLGQQVLAQAGCQARKFFKLMKKEKYSPLELMHEAFNSFF